MYTAGYIYIMRSEHDNTIDGNWVEKYFNCTSIDHNAVNKLIIKNFLLDINNLEH